MNVERKMCPLNDRQKGALFNRLSELRVLITDEVSMVSNALFYRVHQKLNEIFQCDSNIPFAGLPVLICGDFYQLPTVKGLPVYANSPSMKGYLNLDLWRKFRIAELAEVIRQ